MQVAPEDGQIYNQCKRRHMVAIFANKAIGATRWSNLQLMQEDKWHHLVAKLEFIRTNFETLPEA